jgi:YD repeat-containing protein
MGEHVMAKPLQTEYEGTLYHVAALRRMITMTQPISSVTGCGYDTHDNPTSVTDPKGNITQYQSDDFGRRIKVISPDTGTTIYSHDEAGNINQRSDARGTEVSYTYDALNRLTATQFTDPSQNISYSYDSTSVTYGKGRLSV